MRILFDSRQTAFKKPFGTLAQGQECVLNIHIPTQIQTQQVECAFFADGCHQPAKIVSFTCESKLGAYDVWTGKFSLETPALYFYYFRINTKTTCFRLFKQGRDTNMEAGDLWQLTCTPADFTTPDWAKGATIYQVFPDRFCKAGHCDLTGKLQPYTVHKDWYEEVEWKPTAQGLVLNISEPGSLSKKVPPGTVLFSLSVVSDSCDTMDCM